MQLDTWLIIFINGVNAFRYYNTNQTQSILKIKGAINIYKKIIIYGGALTILMWSIYVFYNNQLYGICYFYETVFILLNLISETRTVFCKNIFNFIQRIIVKSKNIEF